jgi:hypothetical protein
MTHPSIWSFKENFDFRRDIGPGNPFHHALERHRGEYGRRKMLAAFELDAEGNLLPGVSARTSEAVLFGGHIGCGKSTELRDYAKLFCASYTVHHLELTKTLDINNLRFSDLVIALATALVATFERSDISLKPDATFVNPVLDWFETRIIKQERFRDVEGEIKTTVKTGGGIPLLASLLAVLTAKIRGGVTYREELRNEIRDGFSQLLASFNALIAHSNGLLAKQGRGPLLFIVDGTDKLAKEDSDTFFSRDVNQLGQIQTNLIVCAPISVLLETANIAQRFKRVQLPMVKIFDADESPRCEQEDALIELILKRMPLAYFDSRDTLRYLVRHSGGHVRDLLRLVSACFDRLDAAPITADIAKLAVRDIAADYQRLVKKDDWPDLVLIDQSHGEEKDTTEERLRLLYNLVLLEYNNYWWRSHPLVRTLPSYAKAFAAATTATNATSTPV